MLPPYVWQQKFSKEGKDATHSYTLQQVATNSNNMSSNIRLEKTCQHCSKNFIAKTTVTQYCSDTCAKRAYKDRIRSKKIEVAIQKNFEQKPFNPIVNQKEFLSVKETCQLIGASRWTIYRLIDGGNLKASKLGSRTIIARNEINNLFK